MKRDEGLAAALFAAVIGGAIAVGIANNITAPLCDAVAIEALAPNEVVFGCLEFWANRYQTTLQTAATVALTVAGLYFVIRQLKEITRQNEITAAALEGRRREQAENRRIVIAKAISGLDYYYTASGILMIEATRQMAMKAPPRKADEIPGIDRTTAANAIVTPALVTREMRARWEAIKNEYAACFAFILANGIQGSAEVFQAHKIGAASIPTDHHEAVARTAGLSASIKDLTLMLEANAPYD